MHRFDVFTVSKPVTKVVGSYLQSQCFRRATLVAQVQPSSSCNANIALRATSFQLIFQVSRRLVFHHFTTNARTNTVMNAANTLSRCSSRMQHTVTHFEVLFSSACVYPVLKAACWNITLHKSTEDDL